jgi:hypothetical protein
MRAIAAYAWQLLALTLASMLLLQTVRLAEAEVREAKAQQALSTFVASQAQASQAEHIRKASALLAHGSAQQENTHDYTQTLQRLEGARAADAGRIASLQHDIRVAATRNAQLAGDAAATRDLAHQHERLAASLAEGAGVVGELVEVVKRRDAEVRMLLGQVRVDSAFLERKFE